MNIKSYLLTIGLSLSMLISLSQSSVFSGTLRSVYMIKYKNEQATGWIAIQNHKEYMITAAHLFAGLTHATSVIFEINHGAQWDSIKGKVLFHKNRNIDIAIIYMGNVDSTSKTVYSVGTEEVAFGQDCFMLGFPYGLRSPDNTNFNQGYPLALIKKAVFSASNTNALNGHVMLFDGMNNPGMSGGPIVIKIQNPGSNDFTNSVVAVISGYVQQVDSVKRQSHNKDLKQETPFGTINYMTNSGIVLAYGARQVQDIIDADQQL